jgi:hypothetical protein
VPKFVIVQRSSCHLYLSGMWVGVDLIEWTPVDVRSKKGWSACLKFNNCSRFNSQHNGEGDLFDHLTSMRILALIMNKIFV